MYRLVTTLVALLITVSAPLFPSYAQVKPESDTIINNRVILTVSERSEIRFSAHTLLEQVKKAVYSAFSEGEIKSVNFLYPNFCALVGDYDSTSIATHLKLLNEGITSIPTLSEQRIQSIKAYLAKPGVELCNQFVVSAKDTNSEKLADTLTHLSFGKDLALEELQPVHKYTVNKDSISSLAESKIRPDSLIGVISSPELNKKFYGLRMRNTKEIPEDGLDNDANAYIDDICGINSSEYEPEFTISNRNGFMTLSVAKDKAESIEYTTVEAAQALLYAIHRCPEQILIPYANDDQVISRMMDRGYQLGIRQVKNQSPVKIDRTKTKTGNESAAPKVTTRLKPSNAGELIKATITGNDNSRVCSYYVDNKNKINTFLSSLNGKKLLGKASWNKATIRAQIQSIDQQISDIGPDATGTDAKKLKKLKNTRKQLIAAQKQLSKCMNERREPRNANPVRFEFIKPIIEQKCMSCHMSRGWEENTEEYFLRTIRVVPQQPDQSALYAYLKNNPEKYLPANMPDGAPALSQLQILLIRQWIDGLSTTPSPDVDPTPIPTPSPTPNLLTPLKDGQRLYAENCMSCHMDLAHSTKFGSTFEQIKAALDPDTGNFSMRALGRVLTDEQIQLITLALNTKMDSQSDNWTLNIGTATYVGSVFRAIFLPDDTTTFTAPDTAINTLITQGIFATNRQRFFGGLCDRFESSCLPEAEVLDQKPAPNVLRTGLELRLLDQILSATNTRGISNALGKINRTTTSPINAQAVQELYSLIYGGHKIPDDVAASIAQTVNSVPNYQQIDYWRFLIKFLFATGHWEVF